MALAALVAVNAPSAFRARLAAALDNGMPPAEAKEILYHAVPYVGIGRVALVQTTLSLIPINRQRLTIPSPPTQALPSGRVQGSPASPDASRERA